MSTRTQMLCVWCGPAFLVVLFGGMLIGGYLPPVSPQDSLGEVADFYRDGTDQVRFGLVLVMAGAGFGLPWVVAITVQMKRIEGRFTPLAWTQLVGGALVFLLVMVAALIFTAVAFRPDRSPELTQLINDLGWITLIMPFPPAVAQVVAIGIAILSDRGARPVFPRWLGYLNFWVAFLFMPAALITFFKDGAFAWNGILGYWLPIAVFGVWVIVMTVMVRTAIIRQAEDEQLEAGGPLEAEQAQPA